MNRLIRGFAVVSLAATLLALPVDSLFAQSGKAKSRQAVELKIKVGQQAPDWELPGTDGKTYKLSQFRGKQAVVVAWYPKALTGG